MNELTPIEILEKLDVFYNNAWNRLVLFTTILLALVGVVIPLIISWWQSRNLKLQEASVKKELSDFFESKSNQLKEELNKTINELFENKIAEVKKYQDKIKAGMEGSHFHLQANTEENPIEKMKSLVWSANGYLEGEDFLNLGTVLEMIVSNLPKIKKEDLLEMTVETADIEELVNDLELADSNNSLTKIIRQIKIELNKLQK